MKRKVTPMKLEDACEKYGIAYATAIKYIKTGHVRTAKLMGVHFVAEEQFKLFIADFKNGHLHKKKDEYKNYVSVDTDRLVSLHARGLMNSQIAEVLGVNPGTITRALARNGLTRNPEPPAFKRRGRPKWEESNPKDYQVAAEMWKQGCTSAIIARRFQNVHAHTIYASLTRNGVTRRSEQEASSANETN